MSLRSMQTGRITTNATGCGPNTLQAIAAGRTPCQGPLAWAEFATFRKSLIKIAARFVERSARIRSHTLRARLAHRPQRNRGLSPASPGRRNPYRVLRPAVVSFFGGRTSAYMQKQIVDACGCLFGQDAVPGHVPSPIRFVPAEHGNERPAGCAFSGWELHPLDCDARFPFLRVPPLFYFPLAGAWPGATSIWMSASRLDCRAARLSLM